MRPFDRGLHLLDDELDPVAAARVDDEDLAIEVEQGI
jgi:hypothetical protein